MPISRSKKDNLFLPIIENQEIAAGVFRLSVKTPAPIDYIHPGQFLMLGFPQLLDPLLPRPFAVFDVQEKQLEVLYKKVGKGTALLSCAKPGEMIRVFGPLGNGFSLPSSDLPPLIIAGGMGIASVHLLLKMLLKKGVGPTLIYGCRCKEELVPLESINDQNMNLHILTEDGSQGAKGTTVDFLTRLSKQSRPLTEAYGAACVCGPVGMLKALAEPLSAAKIKTFFSNGLFAA